MKLKRSVNFFLVFFLLTPLGFAQDKVVVITESWAPYIIESDDQVSGVDYDVMMAVFKNMDINVDFRFCPWKRCIKMMEDKEADAILAVGYNDDRAKFLHYPEEPVSISANVLFYRRADGQNVETINDLTGKSVVVNFGYKYSDEFDKADNMRKIPVRAVKQNLVMLERGRADYFIYDEAGGAYEALRYGIRDKFAIASLRYPGNGNFLAFSKKPGLDDLAIRFSQELLSFKATEDYRAILARYGQ